MKSKIISFAICSIFYCQLSHSQCGIKTVVQDDCCVTVTVLEPSYNDVILSFGDGTSAQGKADEVYTHCHDVVESYNIGVTYYKPNGDPCCGGFWPSPVTISATDIANCEPECMSYVCWEDFYRDGCAFQVLLRLPDGSEVPVDFKKINSYAGSTAWCGSSPTFPIPSQVPFSTGYCGIGIQIATAITDLGYSVDVYDKDPNNMVYCEKTIVSCSVDPCETNVAPCAADEVPVELYTEESFGYFFFSDVEVIQVNAVDCGETYPSGCPPNFGSRLWDQTNCD